jgi:hypothetical protein
MSIFRHRDLACPKCGAAVPFDTVHSVNADRRPAQRLSILAGSFQRETCAACGATFRLDPEFNYVDAARGQWIAAAPVHALGDWERREEVARALFERAYGADAADVAQEIGARLKPRLTFGWPALREKLLAADQGLDDVALEACKATAMRGLDELPIEGASDLRLVAVGPERLVFGWQDNADAELGEVVGVPRALHDSVVADPDGAWAPFKARYDGALFVDLGRDLVARG